MEKCINCSHEGSGKYCTSCGQPYAVKRLTVSALFHEVTHFFTHVDKGFLYTLKELALHPGTMQRNYVGGKRVKHQKPFSMFFVCATITGLAIYWLTKPSAGETNAFEETRIHYYRHYYVVTQAVLIPFYAFVIWLVFRNRNFNYAEILVLFTYSLSFSLLLVIIPNSMNLLEHHFKTEYVEIPLLVLYAVWTNLNFFSGQPAWLIIVKSVTALLICWFTSYFITEQIIRWMV